LVALGDEDGIVAPLPAANWYSADNHTSAGCQNPFYFSVWCLSLPKEKLINAEYTKRYIQKADCMQLKFPVRSAR